MEFLAGMVAYKLKSAILDPNGLPVFDVELLQHHSHPYEIHDVKKEEKDKKSLVEADPGKSHSLGHPFQGVF